MPTLKSYGFIFAILFFCVSGAFCQKRFQILYSRLGQLKKQELFLGDPIEYKVRGHSRFRKSTIANLQDSLVILDDESAIRLSSFKCIRIRRENYHAKLFQGIFMIGAVGYPFLNLVNHALTNETFHLDERALVVSGALLAAVLIIRQLQIKRIRITKNKTLKIVDINYQELNQK